MAEELSEKEALLVRAVQDGNSVLAASRLAGFSSASGGYAALRREIVQNALHEGREATLRTELTEKALKTMEALLEAPTPAATRFSAAKWVLEAGGHGSAAQDDGKDKPLHEMTEAELHRFMARAQRVVEDGGEAPVIRVVAPDTGALPAPSAS